jgi:hypothetical protein
MVKTFSQCGLPGAAHLLKGYIRFIREGKITWKGLNTLQSISTEKVEQYLFGN